MKLIKRMLSILAAGTILLGAVSLTACSKEKPPVVPVEATTGTAKTATVSKDGYALPFTYKDGFQATLKTAPDSQYVTESETKSGAKVIHFTTTQSEDEVKGFYDAYFKKLKPVKPKDPKDDSKGYYDLEGKIIVFNLVVWTADGKTNYKLGCAQCPDIMQNEVWEYQ